VRGNIANKYEEKAEVLNAFCSSVFNNQIGYSQGSQSTVLEDREREQNKSFHDKGGETLEQVAQSGSGCPIPRYIQDQVERVSEQPGLVANVPAHCRGFKLDDL